MGEGTLLRLSLEPAAAEAAAMQPAVVILGLSVGVDGGAWGASRLSAGGMTRRADGSPGRNASGAIAGEGLDMKPPVTGVEGGALKPSPSPAALNLQQHSALRIGITKVSPPAPSPDIQALPNLVPFPLRTVNWNTHGLSIEDRHA